MRPIRQTELLIGVGLLIAALAVNVSLAFRSIAELHDNASAVVRSHEVVHSLDVLFSAVQSAETGQRGYVITGNEAYLQPYRASAATIAAELDRINGLLRSDPQQHDQIPRLRQLITEKQAEMARTIELRKNSFEAARDVVLTNAGRHAMDAIRTIIDDIEARENQKFAAQQVTANDSHRAGKRGLMLAALFGMIAVAAFLVLLWRHSTARSRAASELHAQRELLRATLASIGDGVITTDPHCRVTYLNSIAEKLTGWACGIAVGRPLEEVFRIINEKTRQPAENPCTLVFRDGAVVELANHTVLISRDGRERPIEDSAAPIRDSQGQLFGVVLVFRDATEQRAAAETRERLAAIVESSSNAIIGEDPEGLITTWNKAAEQLFGYSAEEAIGKSIRFLVPPELRPK